MPTQRQESPAEGQMDEFDKQLGAEAVARRAHPHPIPGRAAVRQPSATSGAPLRFRTPVGSPSGGSNGNTPAGVNAGIATPNSSAASQGPKVGGGFGGLDSDLIAMFNNRTLARHVKVEIARMVLLQSGMGASGHISEEMANRIVCQLASELAQHQGTHHTPAGHTSTAGKAPGTASSPDDGRATIESELQWSEFRETPAGTDLDRPNAPYEDVAPAFEKPQANRNAAPPIKPRAMIKTNIRLNPSLTLVQQQAAALNAKRAVASTVTRSASSAFSECSTGSYGSMTQSSIVSQNK